MYFFEKTKGVISVFLIIIMLPLLTSAVILVDGTRYQSAKTMVQEAGDLANAGADAGERGGRRERTWEQTRIHTVPRSLTSIGSGFSSQQVFGLDTHMTIERQAIKGCSIN